MGGFQGQATDIGIHAREIIRMREDLENIFVQHTGQPGIGQSGKWQRPSLLRAGQGERLPVRIGGAVQVGYRYAARGGYDVAAQVDGDPCCTYIGSDGAGHYVKMVHNGIEYGDMQLICEAYDLLKTVLGMTAFEMHDVFAEWNSGEGMISMSGAVRTAGSIDWWKTGFFATAAALFLWVCWVDERFLFTPSDPTWTRTVPPVASPVDAAPVAGVPPVDAPPTRISTV